MSDGSQQAITHVLQQDSKVLGTLLSKLAHLKHLNQILKSALDEKLSQSCQVANLENGHLSVITNNANWATQFRFQIPVLLNKLKSYPEFDQVKTIKCKIIPPSNNPKVDEISSPVALLSPQTAQTIRDIANTITDNKLRNIMLKLSKHSK